ncbi:MAG: hypothetical protein AAF899_00695 [Pseudomonadota bacterium]
MPAASASAEGTAPASRREITLTPTGESYLDAIDGRGVEALVGYWDPDAAAPPLELDPDLLRPDREDEEPTGDVATTTGFIALAVLLATLFAFFVLAGPRRVALESTGSATRPTGRRVSVNGQSADTPPSLEEAVAEADRRRALAMLAEAALIEAARQNGQRLGRAMTMRDALFRIPGAWRGRDALARLARAAEIAHFGGRSVSEDSFAEHLAEARRIFADAVEVPAR